MRDKVLVFNWKERERLQTQLEGVPHLGEVVKAILLLDRSLTQTVGPDWMERTHPGNIIGDIRSVCGGYLIPGPDGVLLDKVDRLYYGPAPACGVCGNPQVHCGCGEEG